MLRVCYAADVPSGTYIDDECPVCLEVYTRGDKVVIFPCKHALHCDCMSTSVKCPLCQCVFPRVNLRALQRLVLPEFNRRMRHKDKVHAVMTKGVRCEEVLENIHDDFGYGRTFPARLGGADMTFVPQLRFDIPGILAVSQAQHASQNRHRRRDGGQ